MQISGGCSEITKFKISQSVKTVFKNNPEILQKISEQQKGKKLTKEHKEKISKKLKGKIVSPEHAKHLSQALKNRQFSEETKRKMSLAKKGKDSSRKGLKWTEKQRKNFPKVKSEETKKRISESMRKHFKKDLNSENNIAIVNSL